MLSLEQLFNTFLHRGRIVHLVSHDLQCFSIMWYQYGSTPLFWFTVGQKLGMASDTWVFSFLFVWLFFAFTSAKVPFELKQY